MTKINIAEQINQHRRNFIGAAAITAAAAQLGMIGNADAQPAKTKLPAEFTKMKRREADLFEGISGYVAEDGGKARLLIGPFRNSREADIFANDLASVHIDAFTWTSQPGQTIRKLSSE